MAGIIRRHSLAFWRWDVHWQALLGIVVGALLGVVSGAVLAPPRAASPGAGTCSCTGLIGDLFMSALKMLVVPLVMAAIVSAIASLGQMQRFARMGGKTLLFYVGTGLVAILTGVALVYWIAPGRQSELSAAEAARAVSVEGSAEAAQMAELTSTSTAPSPTRRTSPRSKDGRRSGPGWRGCRRSRS